MVQNKIRIILLETNTFTKRSGQICEGTSMNKKKRIGRTHRRRTRLVIANRGGVRAHNRPRPNGRKIRVKS
jgi:hypothetical protein